MIYCHVFSDACYYWSQNKRPNLRLDMKHKSSMDKAVTIFANSVNPYTDVTVALFESKLINASYLGISKPYVTICLSNPYHFKCPFNFEGVSGVSFHFIFFSMKFVLAKGVAPDDTPHFAASHMWIYCLHMPHK